MPAASSESTDRRLPRAKFIAQRAEWDVALGDNPRLVASYDQPELRLIRELGWGRRRTAKRRSFQACR